MTPPRSVLSQFEFPWVKLRWQPALLGFSGAKVWRGENGDQPLFALKAWPEGVSAARLAGIHRWMTHAAHLPFVPRVLFAANGRTTVLEAGRLWDVTTWMPGSPRPSPTLLGLRAACTAVARLHSVWRTDSPSGQCPGVRNRLQLLRDWMSSPRPDFAVSLTPRLDSLVLRAVALISRAAPEAIRTLERWEHRPLRLQPCLRDLRSDHVLFIGNEIGGIVDYGAMAEDHPAVDLARLLGDFSWHHGFPVSAALDCYREAGGLLETPDEFVGELTRTGLLGSAIHWLRRLGHTAGSQLPMEQVEARFALLVERIEYFAPMG